MPGKRKDEARRWLFQARYDLKACAWNMEGGFYATACFLAQQAGEKALKALLYYLGMKRRALLTHSVVEMVRMASEQVPELLRLSEPARELDLHYIPARYPNGLPSGYPHEFYSEAMAQRAYKAAQTILGAIEEVLREMGAEDVLQGEH